MRNDTHLSVTLHPEEARSDSSSRLSVNVRMITGTGKNFKSVPKDFDLNSIASKPFQLESNLPYKIEATFFDVLLVKYRPNTATKHTWFCRLHNVYCGCDRI